MTSWWGEGWRRIVGNHRNFIGDLAFSNRFLSVFIVLKTHSGSLDGDRLMAVIANKQCDSCKAINTIWLLPTFHIRIRRCKVGPGSRLRMGSLNLFGLICVAILNYHNYPDLPTSNIVACRT